MSSSEGDAGRARPRRGGRGRAWDRARARPLVPNRGARGTLDGQGLCGSGARRAAAGKGLRAQSPEGRAGPGAPVCGAGVDRVADAGSLCLFISNLIRTASGELCCLTGGRPPIMQTAVRLRLPLTGTLYGFQNCACVWSAVLFLQYPSWLGDRPCQGQGRA